jgi:ABC-type sugar transport system permease subunit
VTTASREKKGRSRFREEFADPERRTAYYMVLPSLLIIIIVAFFPILYGIVLSLTDSTAAAFGSFIGVENYVEMFQDPDFLEGFSNTVIFTAVSVTLEFVLGLAIALAINRAFRGRGLVRAAILVPWAFPTVISAVMWRLMFQDRIGIIQYLANAMGIISEPILSDRSLLLIAAILVDVWKTTPFVALLLLAGLQTIPEDLYRAAEIDGASRLRVFRSITLPMLRPTIAVTLVFRTLDAFRVFDAVYVLTEGGPANTTETLSIYAYKTLVRSGDFGYGSALSVATFFCVMAISVVYLRLAGRPEERA